jgi:hypothetical protein
MRRFTNEERRARLAVRHGLATRSRHVDVAAAARALIGLHGTDPASIFLAARARMRKASVEAIEQALYDDRAIVRMLAMRRTLFVVPVDLVPMVQVAASNAVAANERKRLLQLVGDAGVAMDPARWLERVSTKALAALEELGSATVTEIAARVPELDREVVVGRGTRWEAKVKLHTRVVPLLGVQGRIARGRPRGSWISTQHRWEPMRHWVADDAPRPSLPEARAQLVERWLRAFGPAPVRDLQWWTKWTLGDVRKALAAVDAVDVDIEGVAGVAMADDLDGTPAPRPWVALLPSLDPTVMGWQDRSWFLGGHEAELFDRAGNAGPTVWSAGRVVGTWTQRPNGEIAWRVFDDIGRDAMTAIAKEADALERWLGPTRFTPRFGPRWVD